MDLSVVHGTDCVIFDVDDTLYLERDYVRSGFEAVDAWVRDELGAAGFFEAAWSRFLGGGRGTIFDEAIDLLGLEADPTLVARLVRVYREHRPRIELLPDARSCLERLAGRVRIGVVTDGPASSQRAKLHALGIHPYLDAAIVTAELDGGISKPSQVPFQLIEQQLGRGGPACAYVADNPTKDFRGPKELGWTTIRVRRPGGLHENSASDHYVDIEMTGLDSLAETILAPSPSVNGR